MEICSKHLSACLQEENQYVSGLLSLPVVEIRCVDLPKTDHLTTHCCVPGNVRNGSNQNYGAFEEDGQCKKNP